jgi:pyruvate-formate lyase
MASDVANARLGFGQGDCCESIAVHNAGVFDAYTPQILAARKAGLVKSFHPGTRT